MAITISGQNNNDKILASDGVLDSISGFNVVGVLTATTFEVNGKATTNHISIGNNIHLGNAGIITATTLLGNVTGNINHTSNLLLQINGSEKFRVGNGGQFGIGGANYGTAGQVFTSGGSGSAPTWSTINSDKITEGNNEAEVVDDGSNGYFKVTTEGGERVRVGPAGQIGIAGANYGTSGQVLTSGGSGSTISWTTITGTTINSNADNRVITGSGSANTLNGESNVQIDSGGRLSVGNSQASSQYNESNDLVIGNTTGSHGMTIISANDNRGRIMFSDTYSANTGRYAGQMLYDHQTETINWYSNYTNNGNVAMQLGGDQHQLFVGIDKGSTTTYDNRSAYFHRASSNFVSITTNNDQTAGIVFGDSIANNTANYESYMYHDNSTNDFWIRVNQGSDNRHIKLKQGGNVEIGNGNLVMASGHGIDFSADGSGTLKTLPNSFNAELLHDYENGTFTPNIQYDTGTNRYAGSNVSSAVGEYIRIGDLVSFGMKITLTGNRNYSENIHLYIGGLPYNGMHSSFQSSMMNGWGGWACPTNDSNSSYKVHYCFHGYTTVNLRFSQSSGTGGIDGFYVWGFYRTAP